MTPPEAQNGDARGGQAGGLYALSWLIGFTPKEMRRGTCDRLAHPIMKPISIANDLRERSAAAEIAPLNGCDGTPEHSPGQTARRQA
jgi:hypothetical protein